MNFPATRPPWALVAEKILSEDSVTGYFGPFTEAAVKAYQAKYGLPLTGTVGPMTRARLNGEA